MGFVFGPVASRRFGASLGVDLSPHKKQCNFDCLYCELSGSKTVSTQKNPADPQIIFDEIRQVVATKQIDLITLTANGEPTLYPHLETLIDLIIALGKKTMILSNSSTIHKPEVQSALKKLDVVKLSLDCATKRCFKKLDRPNSVDLDLLIRSIADFRRIYNGELLIEILVVKGFNDNHDEFKALNRALQTINPTRVDIGTIDRPPAYKVKAISIDKLRELAQNIVGCNINIVEPKRPKNSQSYTKNELLDLISRRSLSRNEAMAILDKPSWQELLSLQNDHQITIKQIGDEQFFILTNSKGN